MAVSLAAIGSLLMFSGVALADDAIVWAEVDGYAEATDENNHEEYWGASCEKTYDPEGEGDYTFLLPELAEGLIYSKVIVKAGSDSSTDFPNTIFDYPAAGETVWADTNGNGVYDEEKVDEVPADKAISHIIVCTEEVEETPTPLQSESAIPTPTPVVTPTPVATPTPVVTPTPVATLTPAPTATPAGAVLPGNPTPTVRGAVLPSTALPASGVDVTLVGLLLLMGGGAVGVVSSLVDRKR